MRRREVITLLGGAVVAWPLAARAQQSGRRPTIGFLGTSSSVAWTHWTAAFVRRLGELGWIDGRNVTIEYRWAEGRAERYVEVAACFQDNDLPAEGTRRRKYLALLVFIKREIA